MKQWKRMAWMFVMALLLAGSVGCMTSYDQAMAAEKNLALGSYGQDYDTPVTMLVGDQGKLSLDLTDMSTDFYPYVIGGQIQSVTFIGGDAALSLGEDGTYIASATGSTSITVYIQTPDGILIEHYYILVEPDLTNATLSHTSLEGYIYAKGVSSYEADIRIVGAVGLGEEERPDFTYQSSNRDMSVSCEQSGTLIHIRAYGSGSTVITMVMGEKTWTVKLVVHQVRLSGSDSFYLIKGKTKQLKIKGTSQKVTWKSSNTKIVKVSKKGKIRAKKEGNAVITAQVGTGKIGCVVSVVSKKRKKVINTAIKIGETCKYSQARRMQSGYYDCSSLVWKAYKKMGIRFGDRYYAPTAANNAKWCASNHKIIKGSVAKNVKKMKYLPGALMYETSAKKNGRYKGIYHVEMFTGYTFEGFDAQGKAIVGMKWANRPDNYYGYIGLWSQP
ncbi:MAG: Ig-like domain-containing protein [Eubacteriales bacterium]|nr:Ig-like domain-containing protein [Eubacteriales bacterium]